VNKTSWKPQKPPYRRYKAKELGDLITNGQFVFQIGESPALRMPSSQIDVGKLQTPEYKKKVAYVKKCMLAYRKTKKGRAIAAVQVGIPEHIIVVYTPERKEKLWAIVNPVISKKSETLLRYPEMCMSCNGLIAYVIRPSWVEFTYLDEKGKQHIWNTKDTTKRGKMYNRVLQHEIDHLHGIINIDLVLSKELIFISDPHFYEKADFQKVHPGFAKASSGK